jgi:aspartate-semialdehyde dehydrogenase
MTRIGILHPTTLLGKELIERLRTALRGVEVELLSNREQEIGAVTDVAGHAALVNATDPALIAKLDLLITVGGARGELEGPLGGLREGATALLLAPEEPLGAHPVVEGINLTDARPGRRLLSPDAAHIALAHVVAPLRELAPLAACATVLEPASSADHSGLEEVLGQARALLTFQAQPAPEVFGSQLAFNLLAGSATARRPPIDERLLEAVLGRNLAIDSQVALVGVFHGTSVSVRLELEHPIAVERANELLATSQYLELGGRERPFGSIDAAGRDRVLVVDVHQGRDEHALWLWLFCDNLTRGGAWNAAGIVESLLSELDSEPMVHCPPPKKKKSSSRRVIDGCFAFPPPPRHHRQRSRWPDRGALRGARRHRTPPPRGQPTWRPAHHHHRGRELSGLSCRDHGPGADRPHARSGSTLRCRDPLRDDHGGAPRRPSLRARERQRFLLHL